MRASQIINRSITNLHNHDEIRVTVIPSTLKLRILPIRLILVNLAHPQNIRRNPINTLAQVHKQKNKQFRN
jgi:hypothetical protein